MWPRSFNDFLRKELDVGVHYYQDEPLIPHRPQDPTQTGKRDGEKANEQKNVKEDKFCQEENPNDRSPNRTQKAISTQLVVSVFTSFPFYNKFGYCARFHTHIVTENDDCRFRQTSNFTRLCVSMRPLVTF